MSTINSIDCLMNVLADALVTDTAAADALFVVAEKADQTGRTGIAEAVRTVARMHRAKAIEHQARLNALCIDGIIRRGFDASNI